MSKKYTIREAMMKIFTTAFAADEKAKGQPLRLGIPSQTYEEQQTRIAHASTLTNGRGFMTYSSKVKVGSDRGNKRRERAYKAFQAQREAYAVRHVAHIGW